MRDNVVEIKELSFFRTERPIFKKLDLAVPRGKIIAVMGPSGSGKTTLLKLIGALLSPAEGRILVEGHDIQKLSRTKLYDLRKTIGMLFQNGGLFTNLNVFENVAFALREHTELADEIIREIVLMQLEMVGLRGARELMPNELSGGMARRVALARALVLNPKLMLYDEPFTGQDPITMGVLLKLIKQLNQVLGLTSVIVSHDVSETLSIADYVYVIAESKIVGQGTPLEIENHSSSWIQQFINGLADGPVPFNYPAKTYREDLGL